MSDLKKLTTNAGAPVADNQNTMSTGPRGLAKTIKHLRAEIEK